MWGCFLMSGVKILHCLKDWWKSIPIHQNYTMALMQNFIELYELFNNALLTVRSEMLPFSENNQNIKMFGVPPNTLP